MKFTFLFTLGFKQNNRLKYSKLLKMRLLYNLMARQLTSAGLISPKD